ncbi:MAG: hypothetical protein FJ291_15050 [Planctomycetes bacterium]|nr:hypothetical protein [Planctomycetota bacterium]
MRRRGWPPWRRPGAPASARGPRRCGGRRGPGPPPRRAAAPPRPRAARGREPPPASGRLAPRRPPRPLAPGSRPAGVP